MAHTPTPWTVEDEEIKGPEGEHVICFGHDYDDYGFADEDDLRLIVTAVNAFQPLMEALTELRSFMWAEGYADQSAAMAKADAALRLVEDGDL